MNTVDYVRTMAPTHIAREIAEAAGVTTARVYAIAKTHGIKLLRAPIGPGPSPGLSRSVCTAIVKEARRRGCTVAEVLLDLGVWADSAEGPEVGNA